MVFRSSRALFEPRIEVSKILHELFTAKGRVRQRGRPPGSELSVRDQPSGSQLSVQDQPRRVDVVSEKLCDDVIKYLAPTLKPYKGCTVIDFFPGACVWTNKLHDFLKPKRHILLEPELEYVQPFIKPLLDRPGSTYQHVPLAGACEQDCEGTYAKIFADDGLLPRPPLPADDPRLQKLDTSLLLTGSMCRRRIQRFGGSTVTGSMLSATVFSWSSVTHDLFNQAGLVRMLFWTPGADVATFVPQMTQYRTGRELAVTLAVQTNVVLGVEAKSRYQRKGPDQLNAAATRYTGLDLASSRLTAQRMEALGMTMPQDREVLRFSKNFTENTKESSSSPYDVRFPCYKEFQDALRELSQRWRKMYGSRGVIIPGIRQQMKRTEDLKHMLDTMTYPELFDAITEMPTKGTMSARRIRERHNAKLRAEGIKPASWEAPPPQLPGVDLRVALLSDINLQIFNLELHCKIFEDEGKDVARHKRVLTRLSEELKQPISMHQDMVERDLYRLVDEWLAFYAPRPVLAMDRRAYEPFRAQPEEFYPPSNVSMLEMVPQGLDLSVPGIACQRTAAKVCREFCRLLFTFRSQPVTAALNRITPNAAQDLIPLVPSMTDPRRGGRLDARNLKVRQLTEEMVVGLTKAWFEWPFRPASWELELAGHERATNGWSGTEASSDTAVEEETEETV